MMNNNHRRTHPTTENTGTGWTSHVDVLNSVMDPIDVLSDADLQNELSLYANAQFTFDTLPGVAIEDKPNPVSSFGLYRQPSSHSDTHHHHDHQQPQQRHPHQHPLGLDIPLSTNGTLLNDATSSTLSSPYDQRQHYFSPLSSLPTSPTKLDRNEERQLDPLLSFMMLSTDQQQQQQSQQDLHRHPSNNHLNTSLLTTTRTTAHDVNLTTDHHDALLLSTPRKKPAPATRRGTPSAPSRQGRRQKEERNLPDGETLAATSRRENEKRGKTDDGYVIDNVGGDSDIAEPTYAKDMDDDDEDDDFGSGGGGGGDDTDKDMVKLDKRRRNTAASARFRIKKKMREQSLQRTACEMTEKAKVLENRVHELEREVKWLKDLVVAKNGR